LNFRNAIFIADSPHISSEPAGIRKSLLLKFLNPLEVLNLMELFDGIVLDRRRTSRALWP